MDEISRKQFLFLTTLAGVATVLPPSGLEALPTDAPPVLPAPKTIPPITLSFPPVDAEPLGRVPAGATVLHDGWTMREEATVGDGGRDFSRAEYPGAGEWYATVVPTTPLATLVRHGVYPDPYAGTNCLLIPDASDAMNARYDLAKYSHLPDQENPWAKPYWFRREFTVPATTGGQTTWLHLDGLNYRADVWLNGEPVATADEVAGMFRRFRFDVTRLLRADAPNVLAVRVHPLDFPGDPMLAELGGLHANLAHNGGDAEILRNVTQYCTVGWDWVPAVPDRNVGLWQHVWLEQTPAVTVRDPAAFTDVKLPGGEEAAVTVRCHLQNTAPHDQPLTLEIHVAPENFKGQTITVRLPVTLAAGETREMILRPADLPELVMKNPRLWWPVTYGDQPLYTLTVSATLPGGARHAASALTGVRSVGSTVLPSGGLAFTINGRQLRLTGGAWVPDLLNSWSAQRYRDEVRLMAEGNHTVVRINGCGIIAPDAMLEACDRAGLLVWQDLARTSVADTYRKDGKTGGSRPADVDPKLYLDNMIDSILRLRGHPSLLAWCGCNERVPQEDTGVALERDILPALDGTRPWLPTSSETPAWSQYPTHVTTGGPWHLVKTPEYFRLYATAPGFQARDEIGLPSVLPINSVVPVVPDFDHPDPDTFPFNRTLGFHFATAKFNSLDKILRADLGAPASLGEYLWAGDLYNAACYRAIFEAANKARPRNAGTHLWKTNAAWPCLLWQVYDWYLRPNAGYYAMRSACRALHVQHSVDDHGLQVVSTRPEARPGLRVRFALHDVEGKLCATEDRPVDVPADATVAVGKLPELARDGRLYFLGLDLLDDQGATLDRTVTWFQQNEKWDALWRLAPAAVELRDIRRREIGPETECRVAVVNTAAVPALLAKVAVLRESGGEEVLPCFWTDNALILLPGERRELSVRFRTVLLAGAEPHFLVEGWNVPPAQGKAGGDGGGALPPPLIERCELKRRTDGVRLGFEAVLPKPGGERFITWPVRVEVEGQPDRYVRVSLGGSRRVTSELILRDLVPGKHPIRVGGTRFDVLLE